MARPDSARWCRGLLDDLMDVAAGHGRLGEGTDGERRSGELRAVDPAVEAMFGPWTGWTPGCSCGNRTERTV